MNSQVPLLPVGVTVFERGWLSSNNVLICGQAGCALVDSGYSTHSAQTLALLEAGLQGRPLDLLLNTHLHSDHCGNAALQQAYPNLQTHIAQASPAVRAVYRASCDRRGIHAISRGA